ncbi:YqgE/AlgH family protein [Akkermansiaceae bacterium]|nr:YqgE/AlgH family protein [Akkermansiaceae bacterium]
MEPLTPDHPSLQNQFLISDPALRDGMFHRTVVFLVEHNETNGALGFILNRPSGQLVGDFLKGEEFSPISHVQVHVGGPVSQDHMTFAAFWEEEGHFRYASRISAEEAVEFSHQPGRLVRAFVGYSAWDSGQLEGELETHSWFTNAVIPSLLGHTHDTNLWKKVLNQMSAYHQLIAKAPENILAN